MQKSKPKFEFVCESCGYEAHELEIQKNKLMWCKECAEAEKRRERFRREEEEWNRGVDQKDT